MVSDARFGIELYAEPSGRLTVAGGPSAPLSVVGHVWSTDAALVVESADGSVRFVDPSGANPELVNSSLAALRAFLAEFEAFYVVERPPAPRPMTKEEARAKLAALQGADGGPPPAAFVPAPREGRIDTLRAALGRIDLDATAPESWWGRILDGL